MKRLLAFLLLIATSAAAAGFAYSVFPRAFPVVSLDLRMDREGALDAAGELAREEGWWDGDFRRAASFGQDDPRVQAYLEMEVGGPEVFGDVIRAGIFHPYTWEVRLFRAGEAREVRVRFTPAGDRYGFRLRLPEEDEGVDLPPEEARVLAESEAAARWGFDPTAYRLVEGSRNLRPGGRGDHTFVYEREESIPGAAPLRLRLGVAGDRLAEVTHQVQVPEAFERSYQELRSGNDTVALAATLLFFLLFILGGCGLGALLLYRSGWLARGASLTWGAVVAGLLAATMVNALPLAWMAYDTAVSPTAFIGQQFALAGLVFLIGSPALALIFMAAEGLGRRAFPHHLQFWKLWSPGVGNSDPVLVRTLLGYGLVPLQLAFVVVFYLWAGDRPGWWIPSDTLVQPDLLAFFAPWVTAVTVALQAGLWEESVFRAVPLAGAVLLARRFRGGWVWVVGAMVLQALVFAGAHANYPQQPAHARLTELLVPSVVWGLVYLRFGLLPIILSHYLYNLTWMAIPLFVATAPGLWLDRTLVVAAALAPLAVVLWRRFQHGATRDPAAGAWNRDWTGGSRDPVDGPRAEPGADGRSLPLPAPHLRLAGMSRERWRTASWVAAGLGLVLFVWGTAPAPDVPPLERDRSGAIERAREEVEERAGPLPDAHVPISWVDRSPGQDARYVLEVAGREAYHALMESYLQPAHWHVRFLRMEGTQEERAEEWEVELGRSDRIYRFRHEMAESRGGPTWTESDARAVALTAVRDQYGLEPVGLVDLSAVSSQRPSRVDWLFRFRDPGASDLPELEARIQVGVGAEGVTDLMRYVHVPESWERMDRRRRNRSLGMGLIGSVLLIGAVGLGVVLAGLRWAKGRYPGRGAGVAFGVLLLLFGVIALNGWPARLADLSTARSLGSQLFASGAATLLMAVIPAGVLALLLGLVIAWTREAAPGGKPPATGSARTDWHDARMASVVGGGAGLLVGGMIRAGRAHLPSREPYWPSMAGVDGWSPIVGAALPAAGRYVAVLTVTLFLLLLLGRWMAARPADEKRFPAVLLLLGVGLSAAAGPSSPWVWALAAPLTAGGLYLAWVLLVRWGPLSLVVGTAAAVSLGEAANLRHPLFPGAGTGALLGLALIAVAAVVLAPVLNAGPRPPDGPSRAEQGDPGTGSRP